jgi:hypothetical protein
VLNFASTVFFFVSTVFFFVSTVLNFASTVFFFLNTVLNFVSTVFFFKSYVTIAPPTHQQASMYTFTLVGGGGGTLPPTSPLPLNTCLHNIATRRPTHPSNTQQHTTTHKNTQQQTTTHARDNLRGQKSLGPLKMSLEMAHKVIAPQKKIMSRSFLNSGTLIVNKDNHLDRDP